MGDPELDRAFARFRGRGDVAALGQVFDGVAPELLRIARHLAANAAEAEDLVQATFLTAIERAPEFDVERAIVPWLVGILAHHAANARRRRARRARRAEVETAETVDSGPGPLAQAQERELCSALERELARLPESYRQVLAPFLLEGQRPHEIAARVGLTPGAARVRVHRGLELLRRALPLGFATGAAASLTAGRGLAAVRASVLEAASASAPALAAGGLLGVSSTTWLGGLLLKKSLLCLLVLLSMLCLTWIGWRGELPAPAEVGFARMPLSAVADQSSRVEAGLPAPLPTASSTRSASLAREQDVHCLGRIVDHATSAPLPGARLWTTPVGAEQRVLRATADSDGRVEFEIERAEIETLFVEADGYAPEAVPSTDERRERFWSEAGRSEEDDGRSLQLYELRLKRGLVFGGRVLDEAGNGVAGAELGLLLGSPYFLGVGDERTLGKSGPGGVIEPDGLLPLVGANEQHWIVYAQQGDAFGSTRLGRPAPGADYAPFEIVLVPGLRLDLDVHTAQGAPIAGAWICALPAQDPFPYEPLSLQQGDFLPLSPLLARQLSTHTDAHGRASLMGLPRASSASGLASEQRYLLEVWRDKACLWRGLRSFRGDSALEIAVPEPGSEYLCGTVRDEQDRPLEGASVVLELHNGTSSPRSATSAADGSYRLALVAGAGPSLALTATYPGKTRGSAWFSSADPDFRLDRHDFTLREPLPLAGALHDNLGNPLAGVRVQAQAIGSGTSSSFSAPSDAQGRFRIEDAFAGEFHLQFLGEVLEQLRMRPDTHWRARGGALDVEIVFERRTGEPCTLVARASSISSGRALELLAASLIPVEASTAQPGHWTQLVAGEARFTELEPGRYDLWLATSEGTAHAQAMLATAGETLELSLSVPRAGRIEGRVEFLALARPEPCLLAAHFVCASGSVPFQPEFSQHTRVFASFDLAESERFELPALLPGTWSLRLWGEGLAPAEQRLEVEAGALTSVVLGARPGARLQLDLSAWSTEGNLQCELSDLAGAVQLLTLVAPQQTPMPIFTLEPGPLRWRVWRMLDEPHAQSGEIELVAGELRRVLVPGDDRNRQH